MTVQELINLLVLIKDKHLQVSICIGDGVDESQVKAISETNMENQQIISIEEVVC